MVWGRGEGRGQGALTQSQPGSSGQAPACSVMLYCVASEITDTRHNHNQTVGSKLGKIRLVLVLLIIAFVTPDLKGYIQPSSQNISSISEMIFVLFCLVLQCSARLVLVWREREDWETGLNRQAVIQSDKKTCVRAPSYWLLTIFCIFKAGMRRYSCQLCR